MSEHEQLFTGEDQTAKYRVYRPGYPKELFEHIADYYFDKKNANEKIPLAVDVACGSGQATADLSLFCERVIGIDVSKDQLAHAIPKDNIEYRCNKAEDLSFLLPNSVDLVTIATALHWLDVGLFIDNVKRVLKPRTGVFAVWTYGFGTLDNPQAHAINYEFAHVRLAEYWHGKKSIIENYYQLLLPLFPYQSTFCQHTIERQIETTLGGLLGFIESTSVYQTFRRENGEEAYQELLNTLRQKLIQCYIPTEGDSNNDQKVDVNSIKVTISNPVRLYLMKKDDF